MNKTTEFKSIDSFLFVMFSEGETSIFSPLHIQNFLSFANFSCCSLHLSSDEEENHFHYIVRAVS